MTLNAGSNAIALTQSGNILVRFPDGGAVQSPSAQYRSGRFDGASLAVISSGGFPRAERSPSRVSDIQDLEDTGVRSRSETRAPRLAQCSSRNGADTTDTAGTSLSHPARRRFSRSLATTGNITLTAASGATLSQDGTSTLNAAGLELLGSGRLRAHRSGANVSPSRRKYRDIAFRENGGFRSARSTPLA